MFQNIEYGLTGTVTGGSGGKPRGTQQGSPLESAADDTHRNAGFLIYLKDLTLVPVV